MPSQLFQPIILRGMTLSNRIIIAPMCQYSAREGSATSWHTIHLGNLALSGAGLLILEAAAVEPQGRISPDDLGIWSDENEAALKGVIATVREHSPIKLGIQLAHAGRKASTAVPWAGMKQVGPDQRGWTPVAPSAVPFQSEEVTPIALDESGLARVKAAFVQAAERAARIGFDMIELHGAHGYLLHEFLSPLSNHRTDAYGGDLEGRMRFPLEVFEAVRAVWPQDKPISVRVSATDWVEGGWDRGADCGLRQGAEGTGPRHHPRLLRRRFARAEDRYRRRLSGRLRRTNPARDGASDHRRGPDHRSASGRADPGERSGRHGRPGARHPLRSALALARGGGAGRPGSRAEPVSAFPAARPERPVRLSVAFTKEGDAEAGAADLPDRPISPHPNLVTPHGLAALDAAYLEAKTAYAAAQSAGDVQADRTAMARATRDLRYYAARRASAQLIEPAAAFEAVQFGAQVTFDREDGRRQTFRIVGEDEADPANGSVSYVSPLARALLGKRVGDTAIVAGGEVEIIAFG